MSSLDDPKDGIGTAEPAFDAASPVPQAAREPDQTRPSPNASDVMSSRARKIRRALATPEKPLRESDRRLFDQLRILDAVFRDIIMEGDDTQKMSTQAALNTALRAQNQYRMSLQLIERTGKRPSRAVWK
ncbi:MAG TPA: hypothetical protein VL625_00175 [Patescibacteria group bacterium]|nr:hypothetical protein [Patescibacteria group bacterium]